MTRRSYDNSRRTELAAQTRSRIVAATAKLLAEGGYDGLNVAAVARAANVSPQTIYNSVGNKGALLKACYDVTLAGDEDAVPMSERPEFLAMQTAGDRGEFVRRYAAWIRHLNERAAGIAGPLLRLGVAHDAGAATFVATIEQERRIGTTHAMTGLRDRFGLPDGMTLEEAIDVAWTINSPESYDRLVERCGWTPAAYESWVARHLGAEFLRGEETTLRPSPQA